MVGGRKSEGEGGKVGKDTGKEKTSKEHGLPVRPNQNLIIPAEARGLVMPSRSTSDYEIPIAASRLRV